MKSSNFAALMKKGKRGKKADVEPAKPAGKGKGKGDVAFLKRKKMPA